MISTKEKGITLIALIITIIVMLILVAVTINVALNGELFDQAKDAAKKTQIEADREQLLSAMLAAIGTDGQLDENNIKLPDGWKKEGDEYISPDGNKFKIENDEIKYIGDEGSSNPENPQKVELKVGDYVDYPASVVVVSYVNRAESGISYGGEADEKGQGYNPDISTNGGWRVLNVDEGTGKITLISATASTPQSINETNGNGSLVLKDEQVYNNGVEILNRVCDELYTVNGLGKARSINIEDIYSVLDKELPKLSSFTINASANINSKEYDNSYYPIKLADEIGTEIDGGKITEGLSSHSELGKIYLNDSEIYNGTSSSGTDRDKTYKQFTNTLKLTDTTPLVTNINTSINSLTDETLKEVILGKDETRPWWIATRSIIQDSNRGAYYAGFGMMRVNNGKTVEQKADFWTIDYSGVTIRTNVCDYNYGSTAGQLNGYFRPVIELDASKTIDTTITDTTDGSFEHPWPIADK